MNLFCLPAAGTSAWLYASWKKLVPNHIHLLPIEYPGHGALARQALTHSPEALTRHVIAQIASHGRQPFILFGHSVGAALLWRVEQQLRQTGLYPYLKLLVVSGRPELTYTRTMAAKGSLDREGLINALRHYNSVSEELLQNSEAMDFFLQILRNDFQLNDNMLQDEIQTTKVPLVAFYGLEDPDIANEQQMLAWQQHSLQWLGCYGLAGDHFFFNNLASRQAMLDKICQLADSLAVAAPDNIFSAQVTNVEEQAG
jgi:surfactin synthase thioesterase subunit